MTNQPKPAELLVCVKCRRQEEVPEDEARPGEVLYNALNNTSMPPTIKVIPVECLSNCSQGCTIALRSAGRWSYVYGNLNAAEHLHVILEGASRYQATTDGLVPWRGRPEHFRKNCIARIPPLEVQDV
ncbi:DUF1636 family protein [Parasulfitobacter algicola]|uniref:DUF1636 domain-containing protein n=1 Tax=Parasulfitobacter algicola TaxID=2614809 RepID=A0ABX2IWS3_9RHOB|nr:DUF1636 domain-containing protein [Sulfitobacter algicola]NSX56825.1 DUF1636 domain-containing protein [Sulfitobacter algicola]